MKKLPAITALALALISGLAQADRLEDIRKAGVLRVASFDSNPPFGFVDAKSKQIEGLDVDYAKALADKLGVRLQVLPTNPANRIPLLTANKVDLVLANFTITRSVRSRWTSASPTSPPASSSSSRKAP